MLQSKYKGKPTTMMPQPHAAINQQTLGHTQSTDVSVIEICAQITQRQ
jgi:hypothetical protein